MRTKIEVALGVNPDSDSSGWAWFDASSWALGTVQIVRGRADQTQDIQATRVEFRLRNSSLPGHYTPADEGRWTPNLPGSVNYGLWDLATPVRISIDPDGGGYHVRVCAYVDSIELVWPGGPGGPCEARIIASGILRRLGQGVNPVTSPMRRAITAEAPVAYWPLEDLDGSASFAGALPGMDSATFTDLDLASNTGLAGSAPLPNFKANTSSFFASFARTTNSGQWQIDFHCYMPSDPGSDTVVLQVNTDGTLFQWNIWFCTGGSIKIVGYDRSLSMVVNQLTGLYPGTTIWGQWVHFHLDNQVSGSNTNWNYGAWPSLGGSLLSNNTGSFAGTPGNPSFVCVPAGANLGGYSLGHIVWYDAYNYLQPGLPAFGYPAEWVDDRLTRLCAERGIPFASTGAVQDWMGPQKRDTFLPLVKAPPAIDGGILSDGPSFGLTYITGDARRSRAATMTVTAAQLLDDFRPKIDDTLYRDRWTVTRDGGSSATATSGDRVDDSVTLQVYDDTMLLPLAQWFLWLSTQPGMRMPSLSFDLLDHPELQAGWLACDLGHRITVPGSVMPNYPTDVTDLSIEGYTETFDAVTWRVQANVSSYIPWRILELASDTGDTNEFLGHLDADPGDITLGADYAAGATSITVNVGLLSGLSISTTADDAPIDLEIDGWKVHVTSVGAPTQTAPSFVAEYESAWSTTTPKTVLVDVTAGDWLVILGATEDDATGIVKPYGGTGLTYTQVDGVSGFAGYAKTYCWVTQAPSTQSFGLGATSYGTTGVWGLTVMRFSRCAGIGASADTHVASGAPSLALTTTAPNSAIAVINADAAAVDGSSRTWRTINSVTPTAGNGYERSYNRTAGVLTVYAAYWPDAGTAASKTTGLSAPSGQKYSIVAVEVLGAVQQTLTVDPVPGALSNGSAVQIWQMPVLGR